MPADRRHDPLPWLIIAGGAALRVVLLAVLAGVPLRNDQAIYWHVAGLIVRGEAYSPDWPPAFPYYLALVRAVAGDSALAARAAMALLYLPFMLLFLGLLRPLVRRRTLGIVLAAVSLWPAFLFHSLEPLTQLPAALLLLLVTATAVRACRRPSAALFLALGLALGVAALLRPASALLFLVVPAVLWRHPAGRSRARRLVFLCAAAAAALAPVAGWTWQSAELTGRWPVINYNNARNMFYGNNPYTPLYRTWWLGSHGPGEEGVDPAYTALIRRIDALPMHERDALFRRLSLEHIAARPDLFLLRSANRARCYCAFDTFTGSFLGAWYGWPRPAALAVIAADAALYLLAALAALAALAGPLRGALSGPLLLVGTLAALASALPYVFSFAHPTYHLPVLPLVLLPAALVLDRLFDGDPAGRTAAGRRRAALVLDRLFGGMTARQRRCALAAAAVLLAIQIEWVIAMAGRV